MYTHPKRLTALFFVGAATFVLAACGGAASNRSTETVNAEPQVMIVNMSELKFEPATIKVKAGRPVHLTAKNVGTADHDWVISNMPVADVKNTADDDHGAMMQPGTIMADTTPGHAATVEFTPISKGTFDVYCSKPGHTEAGMKGAFKVE